MSELHPAVGGFVVACVLIFVFVVGWSFGRLWSLAREIDLEAAVADAEHRAVRAEFRAAGHAHMARRVPPEAGGAGPDPHFYFAD